MRRDSFISPELNTIQKLENSHLTRSLALFLQNIDKKEGVIYGVEIKSNGSERSSRIPLVRFSDESVSIWKIASNIESVEKTVTVLNDLFYFLKDHSDESYKLPMKVLVLMGEESLFNNNDSKYKSYLEKIIAKNNILIISFDFLQSYLQSNQAIDMEKILSYENKKILTTLDL
jgi:hypothetical protein